MSLGLALLTTLISTSAAADDASLARDPNLRAGMAALADFRPTEAVRLLEQARTGGPHRHADHVLLYAQLGIAYAYLERTDASRAAFRRMLALDPSAAISYTLSPKVTFLFEQARQEASGRPRPALDVRWPRDLTTDGPVPIDLEVVADPERFLARGRLMYRVQGEPTFHETRFELPGGEGDGPPARVELAPPAPEVERATTLELYVVAEDRRGNEVLTFASPHHPRELPLTYAPPTPWYSRWWVWVLAGTAVAAAASTAVYFATESPPDTVEGRFVVIR